MNPAESSFSTVSRSAMDSSRDFCRSSLKEFQIPSRFDLIEDDRTLGENSADSSTRLSSDANQRVSSVELSGSSYDSKDGIAGK